MSFSGNPLGQGSRIDRHTFMNNKQSRQEYSPEDTLSTSPRRAPIPVSYAYGAPTLTKHSPTQTSPNRGPSPTRSTSSSLRNHTARTVRYARLKQRNQALGPSNIHQTTPGIILSPPDGTSLRDTSVNVATAFHQAASNAMPSMSGNYEKPISNRRIAAPPSKSRKPNSNALTGSIARDESFDHRSRAKSPLLDTIGSAAQTIARALSPPTSYFLRESEPQAEAHYQPLRMEEPPPKSISQQDTKASTVPSNDSYDYEAEERLIRGADVSTSSAGSRANHQKKKSSGASTSARLSLDNKAYRPPSDEEEDDDDFKDDSGHRRRKGKKKDEGKSVTALPTIGYDKKRKKKKRGAQNEDDESASAGEQVCLLLRRRRAGSGEHRAASRERGRSLRPQPGSSRASEQRTPPTDGALSQMEAQQPNSTSRPQSTTGIGGFLGRIVHVCFTAVLRRIVQIIVLVFFLFWAVIGVTAAALYPSSDSIGSLINDLFLNTMSKFPRSVPSYHAPGIPPESVQDLIVRLTRVETALADFASTSSSKQQQAERQAQRAVDQLHTRLESESQRAREAEERYRTATAQGLAGLRNELESLQAEWERTRSSATEEEIRELKERIGMIEGGVKDAIELGKRVEKGMTAGGRTKWHSGEGLTVRSSDGQDVSDIIGSMVDRAMSRFYKDGLAKPDFALYSAGGRVIPQLTSDTYEIKPKSWGRYLVGSVTGSGYALGRPPVTALHHDVHVGNCWPFAGTRGQLGVLLARNAFISEVTIEHAPKDVAYDLRAAPREMELWGLVQGTDNVAKVRGYQANMKRHREEIVKQAEAEGVQPPPDDDAYPSSLPRSAYYLRLARFTYDARASDHLQTFSVPKEIQDIGADFGIVVLIVKSNWGDNDFTCLYRMRVHGTDKDSRPFALPEPDLS
ncbi:hypothetical protein BU17DRAFT_40899 [Hysterangium stoloniferum]|nr:hypothetical protein BU17DRAFT_40899 [Hysterangium stoloniferum]